MLEKRKKKRFLTGSKECLFSPRLQTFQESPDLYDPYTSELWQGSQLMTIVLMA